VSAALLVHGLGAHSGWFEALGRRLKVRRIFALAYDQVGFGKRRDEKFVSQQQWFDDLIAAYSYLSTKVGNKPIFVMGNSMGAAVSLKVVADEGVKPAGLVMFSPGFDGHPARFKLSYRISTLTKALINPETEVSLPYTPDMVTRSESVRNWLNNDPDMRFSPTGKMLLELLKMSLSVPKIRKIGCPVFMITSGIDSIVDGKASKRIFDRLDSPEKKELVFPEAWHDLMFDPVIDELIDELATWTAHVSSSNGKKG
jgi:alpha-beta hydrolase superfamily lysophospholipase